MKHYILFTQEELEDMLNGCEIMHRLSINNETLYFMCKEHFLDEEEYDEKSQNIH